MGLFLFSVSFVVPSLDRKAVGISAFAVTAQTVYEMCASGEILRNWDSARFAVALGFGWISNFSVFFRLPLLVAAAMVTAPWVLFSGFLFFNPDKPEAWVAGFIPFYPWAFGISLVNYARILELRKPAHLQTSQHSNP